MAIEDAIRIIAEQLHPSVRAQVLGHLPVPEATDAEKEAAAAAKQAAIDKARADLAALEAQ